MLNGYFKPTGFLFLFFLITGMLFSSSPVEPQSQVTVDPGYYQFYKKTGDLTLLEQEKERDEKILSGDLSPVAINEPVIDLRLPNARGDKIGLRDYIGKKNVVLATTRAWW